MFEIWAKNKKKSLTESIALVPLLLCRSASWVRQERRTRAEQKRTQEYVKNG